MTLMKNDRGLDTSDQGRLTQFSFVQAQSSNERALTSNWRISRTALAKLATEGLVSTGKMCFFLNKQQCWLLKQDVSTVVIMPDLRVNSSHSRKQPIKAAQPILDSRWLFISAGWKRAGRAFGGLHARPDS